MRLPAGAKIKVFKMPWSEQNTFVFGNLDPYPVQPQAQRTLMDDDQLIVTLDARTEDASWRIKNITDHDRAMPEMEIQFIDFSGFPGHRTLVGQGLLSGSLGIDDDSARR
jgi:hypothetical protein